MREALVPFAATALLAFVVHRWLGDELERERRLSPGAVNAALALALLHALLVSICALAGVTLIGLPAVPALVVGLVLAGAGAALAIAAVKAVASREQFLAMRPTERIVQQGPYRFSRHPFYLGWTLVLLGIAVAGRSAVAVALVAVLALALIRIAAGEERWLSAELGSDYDDYREHAPAVIGALGSTSVRA